MKHHYCRYCQKDVPMLDEVEYEVISRIHGECIEAVKQYRSETGATLEATPLTRLYQPVQDAYARFVSDSGFNAEEFEVDEIMRRHRLLWWEKSTAE